MQVENATEFCYYCFYVTRTENAKKGNERTEKNQVLFELLISQ